MTGGESITLRVAEALEACGIPFLLSGSFVGGCRRHGTLRLLEEVRRLISTA